MLICVERQFAPESIKSLTDELPLLRIIQQSYHCLSDRTWLGVVLNELRYQGLFGQQVGQRVMGQLDQAQQTLSDPVRQGIDPISRDGRLAQHCGLKDRRPRREKHYVGGTHRCP